MTKNYYTALLLLGIFLNSINASPVLSSSKYDSFTDTIIKAWREKTFAEQLRGRDKPEVMAITNCSLDQSIITEIQSYQDVVNQIIDLFITGTFKGMPYDVLAEMTDAFGPRLTGSQALDDAIDWILNRATLKFFDDVHNEPVIAPHWVRNNESLYMVSPRLQQMPLKGLGTTIGTDPEGITAEILVVTSFDDLDQNAQLASGKIIVYNVPFTNYGDTVQYRSRGAQEAARVGGVASLVRSLADFSIASPHTGTQTYSDSVTKIPSACITIEDAEMLYRMQLRGEEVTLRLQMEAINYEDVLTRNAIVGIQGSSNPEEVVVVSGHIDSWDVGTGAMDDGGGSIVSLMASEAIMELNLRPRRSFRTVLFTAEEEGIYGGEAYFAAHSNETQNFQIMMESDFGTFYPRGIQFTGTHEASCIMQEILSLTTLLGTDQLLTPADTPDLGAFGQAGVPLGSLYSDSEHYFWFHHSEGDTMAVQDSDSMDRVAALWTSVSYVLADVSFRLPQQ